MSYPPAHFKASIPNGMKAEFLGYTDCQLCPLEVHDPTELMIINNIQVCNNCFQKILDELWSERRLEH